MFELAFDVLTNVLHPTSIMFMLVGVCVGILVGILPGLGGTVGMSLMLPFLYGMDPNHGIPLLIGMTAVIHTSDTFPSVLIGVPGSSGSQATIMDGYPLAQKGEAARALGAAFFASMLGGLFGALVLCLILPVARPVVLSFGSPELLMLSILGLSMAGVLAGKRPIRGIIAGLIGLVIGGIGAAPMVAEYRFVFGMPYLWDGIPIAVLALGLFALPEILDLLAARTSIAKAATVGRGALDGIRDVVRNKLLVLRCSGLGVLIGSIPGLGGSIVDWISYGQVVQTARDRSMFGKGDIRGVIAPESSNNAKEGGALIPTLLFGIPGSGTMAVLLGGFILMNINPGPRMIEHNLDQVFTIVWSLAIANVFGAGLCLLLSQHVARLCTIRAGRLAPFLLVIMVMGAYQATRDWGDLMAFLLIGLLGWVMKHMDYPRAPLLIGYVLSMSVERYLWISMSRFGYEWMTRPAVIVIGVITVALLYVGTRVKQKSMGTAESDA